LARSKDWFADGTFKVVPNLYNQLYTIHGIVNNTVIPAVFALLPSRNESTYIRLLTELKILEPNLAPDTIMTDFEVAAINAFGTAFPGAQQKGCFFHFCQCIYRNIQSNGLQQLYENDAEFSLAMRMLPAIAFVPLPDILTSFEELCNSNIFPVEAQAVLDYFEDIWIGRPDRRQSRRRPRFATTLWNCYESTLHGDRKTNNSCEGWHRAFSELISASHPTIWKFIGALKDEQSSNEGKIERFIAGATIQSSKKRYRDVAKRLQRAVQNYGNLEIIDYLRGLAHNIGL
jgi:hypothetical protein